MPVNDREPRRAGESAIDLWSASHYPASALSTFAPNAFEFRGVEMASMAGLLQGLRVRSPTRQATIFRYAGADARRASRPLRRRALQQLFWDGTEIDRLGEEYQLILDDAFRSLYTTNADARRALSATGHARLECSGGCRDPRWTVLTADELCVRLVALRDAEST